MLTFLQCRSLKEINTAIQKYIFKNVRDVICHNSPLPVQINTIQMYNLVSKIKNGKKSLGDLSKKVKNDILIMLDLSWYP